MHLIAAISHNLRVESRGDTAGS
eukprot:COSAG02_NODE_63788_length_262_cov_0.638037_1_plen_22_part_01